VANISDWSGVFIITLAMFVNSLALLGNVEIDRTHSRHSRAGGNPVFLNIPSKQTNSGLCPLRGAFVLLDSRLRGNDEPRVAAQFGLVSNSP
jgi:hypothetical protein